MDRCLNVRAPALPLDAADLRSQARHSEVDDPADGGELVCEEVHPEQARELPRQERGVGRARHGHTSRSQRRTRSMACASSEARSASRTLLHSLTVCLRTLLARDDASQRLTPA